MKKFALLIALALACGEAGALKCYVCTSLLPSYPNCEGPDSKYLEGCPAPPTGRSTRCSKLDGVLSATSIGGDLEDFERVCTNFATNNLPENKCYTDNDAKKWILEAVDPSIRPLLNASFSFKGNLCVCDTDGCNGVASVKPFLGLLVAVLGLYVFGVWR